MKIKKITVIAIAVITFVVMATCLYCATFADFPVSMKICFGIAAAIFYGVINLIPYFLKRKNNAKLA